MRNLMLLLLLFICPAISSAATLSGTVTDSDTSMPIEGATVAITDPAFYNGNPLAQTQSDASGNYTITFTVDPAAFPSQSFAGAPAVLTSQLLIEVVAPDNAPARSGDALNVVDCFWFCELNADLTPDLTGVRDVNDGDVITQDFVLEAGAIISGNVSAAGGGPLAEVPLFFYTPEPFEDMTASVFRAVSDAAGDYTSEMGFKPGTYYAGAGRKGFQDSPLPYGNFVSQAYSGFACEYLACAIRASSPINIVGSTDVPGIDFSLPPGGELSGELVYADSGLPLSSPDFALIRVWTPDEGRNLATFFVQSDRFGGPVDSSYLIEGLAGSYIIEIDPSPSFQTNLIRILNDGQSCPFGGCDRAQGVPVTLLPGSPVNRDFALEQGGKVTGTVTDIDTGLPIDGLNLINIALLNAAGRTVGGGVIDADGTISIADGVVPGDYSIVTGVPFFAKSFSGQGDDARLGTAYADQIYMDVDCPGLACDQSAPGATLISIAAGGVVSDINFSLRQGFRISGTVTDAVTGNPLDGRNVEIFTTSGRRVALEFTDIDGQYATGGLPDGDYRVVVKDGGRVVLGNYGSSGLGYFGQVFGSASNCVQDLCSPTSGSNVSVAGANVSAVDFALNAGPTISGQVIDTGIGLPILLTVDVFNAGGTRVGAWSTINTGDAVYTTGALSPGTYTLIPRTTRTYSIGSPATVPKGASAIPGTRTVEVTDANITSASLGVFQSLVFASGFEAG